ncbi:MAG TPA: CARDB domain-containing protein [Methanospirillum sp.]|uniref:CARDB domain-containing protein n=1 Tax=Methanospirillum sp. TaxID=45200 RepID=UPI002B9646E8|nr:CARDB domain-containing protein [Methanospirillum sp.]HOJ95391.1 CARDB domain-containing protein [Methanospirillum sp.]
MNYGSFSFGLILFSICLFCFCITVSPGSVFQGQFILSSGSVTADNILPRITGLSMNIPHSVQAGTYLRLVDIIRNDGTSPSGPFFINYILEDPTGVQDTRTLGTVSVPNLVRGGQKKVNVTFPVPPDLQPGNYQIRRFIYTDPVASYQTGIYLSGAEGMIEIMNYEPYYLTGYTDDQVMEQDTQALKIRSIIKNSHDEFPVETKLSYYLSGLGLISDNPVFIGSTEDLTIQPKTERTIETTLPLPGEIRSGTNYLITAFLPVELLLDDSSLYWISDTPISVSSSSVPIPTTTVVQPVSSSLDPDVMTVKTEYPDIMYIGESVKLTDSVTNIGGATAGIVRVEYLLSSDDAGSDTRHLDYWTIHNLKGGETRTSQVTVGIPGGIRPGIYYLTKKITVTSNPPEKNTANNIWTGNRPVRVEYNPTAKIPDLTHVTTRFPCGNPGEKVEISDTIANIGNACAQDVRIAYYLSPYASFDPATARYLGVWEINSICVGEQKTQTTTVTIPADLTNGAYYWFSVIDPCTYMPYCGDEMPELDKSNNINSGPFYIGPCVFCGCP